jgi:hypothetical protein
MFSQVLTVTCQHVNVKNTNKLNKTEVFVVPIEEQEVFLNISIENTQNVPYAHPMTLSPMSKQLLTTYRPVRTC